MIRYSIYKCNKDLRCLNNLSKLRKSPFVETKIRPIQTFDDERRKFHIEYDQVEKRTRPNKEKTRIWEF